jgi:hypothetical protein
MIYEQFIGALREHETPHIKALSFPESCSPKKIPDAFLSLLPQIIKILEKQLTKLCKLNQVVALFGLQTAPIAIKSTLPVTSKRIINIKNTEHHLCCSLSYLITSAENFNHIKSWEGAENIIIDFTSGEIMDSDYYIAKLSNGAPKRNHLYGALDASHLDAAWKSITH